MKSKNRQAKGYRDKINRLGRVIRRIQSGGHVLANVGNAVSSRASRHGKARREHEILGLSDKGMTDRKELA